jgi:hypothetical protein
VSRRSDNGNEKHAANFLGEANVGLAMLVGARLTSVQFVLNYLILGFDGKGALTTLVWPQVIVGPKAIDHETQGYRDALCSLIEDHVSEAAIDDNRKIGMKFSSQRRLEVALSNYEGTGERAILTGPSHYLLVF